MANLSAVISADTSKFVKEVQSAQDMLKKFVSQTESASKGVYKNTSATNEQVNAYKRVVKQLEKVASGNMSTTQQTKALEAQVKELKIQWANLSNEAKNSDFGKAISASLSSANNQLSTLKTQMNQVSESTIQTNKSTASFKGGIGGLIGAFKKYLPVVGGAVAVQKTFKGIIEGSQTTGDAFANTMYTSKNVLKEFASAISTMDFSSFAGGLDSIIQKGWDAAAAIDQLGNTIMSYNVKAAKANQKLAKARAIIYDPESTPEQIKQAKKDMADALTELKSAASVMLGDYETALISEVNARGGTLSGEGAISILDKWLEADTSANREHIKAEAKAGYDIYIAELQKLNNDTENLPTKTVFTSGGMFGGSVAMEVVDTNSAEYKRRLEALNNQYKDQIAYHVLLDKYQTEELEKLGQQRIAMVNLNAQVDSYSASMSRLNNRKTGGSGSGSGSDSNAAVGSIAYINQQIALTKKLKDEQEVGTQEWWNQVNALKELNNQLENLEAKEKRITSDPLPQLTPLAPITGKVTTPVNKLAGKSPFENAIKALDDYRDHYNKVMDDIEDSQAIIGAVGNIFNALGGVVGENGQQWVQFGNQVMQSIGAMLPQIASLIAANQAAAVSEGASSAAKLPFPGNVVAIASIVAELLSIFAALPKFASGGIIGGNSPFGDYNIARVNSGEMILNGSQQKRLFNILDGSEVMSPTGSQPQVEFKIKGTELIGCINNVKKKNSKI